MSNTSKLQADLTLDFDTAEKAKARRNRRSSIFERSRIVRENITDDTFNMDLDSSESDWKKCYIAKLEKEMEDWVFTGQSIRNQVKSQSQKKKAKAGNSLELAPHQLLSKEEKKFLEGSKIYKTFSEKIYHTAESFALALKLQCITDRLISESLETLEIDLCKTTEELWIEELNKLDYSEELIISSENVNLEDLPYPEPFLDDFTNV